MECFQNYFSFPVCPTNISLLKKSFILLYTNCRRTIVPLRNSIRKLRRKENVDKDELNLIGVKVTLIIYYHSFHINLAVNKSCAYNDTFLYQVLTLQCI